MPLTFYQTTPHGANCLHTALLLPHRRSLRPPGISIRKLNIWDGRGFGLAQAIQAVDRRGFNVMILTKTKISTTAYCRNRLGYEVT